MILPKRVSALGISLCFLVACEPDTPALQEATPIAAASHHIKVSAALESCPQEETAFIRQSVMALYGRHVLSQAELDVLAEESRALGREHVLDQLMRSEEYITYWSAVLGDFLSVNRFGERVNDECSAAPATPADERLAAHIRDNHPLGQPFESAWTQTELFQSAVRLDDLSPVYRAALFTNHGSRVIDADDDNDERAFRRLYSGLFEQNYLGRRMDCLRCHNSEYSVTAATTFPLPGLVERAVYGDSAGRPTLDLHGAFRVHGVLALRFQPDNPGLDKWEYGEGVSPWGLSRACGQFVSPEAITEDQLGYTAYLGGDLGPYGSIWDVEALLHEGLDRLAADGLQLDSNNELTAPMALGWMLSATVANKVWTHITGSALTAPHNLPRNANQQERLHTLATQFYSSRYSLKSLLKVVLLDEVVTALPLGTCGQQDPYPLPPVFNPWTVENEEPELRKNGVGDRVVRHPPLALIRAAAIALEWSIPNLSDLYERLEAAGFVDEDGEEPMEIIRLAEFQTDFGLFMSDSETGFRGSSFRETLAWEHAVGVCAPFWETDMTQPGRTDFISRLMTELEDASVTQLAIELKNRLLAEPELEAFEMDFLSEMTGSSPDFQGETAITEMVLRRYCTALLMSPDFQLSGIPPEPAAPVESLLPEATREGVCATLREFWSGSVQACTN